MRIFTSIRVQSWTCILEYLPSYFLSNISMFVTLKLVINQGIICISSFLLQSKVNAHGKKPLWTQCNLWIEMHIIEHIWWCFETMITPEPVFHGGLHRLVPNPGCFPCWTYCMKIYFILTWACLHYISKTKHSSYYEKLKHMCLWLSILF